MYVDHAADAKRLLEAHRLASEDADTPKSPGGRRRRSHEGIYTYKEVNSVLSQLVEEGASGGLVKAVLELGGDVNFIRRRSSNIWKKVTGKNQEPERNDILLRAAKQNKAEVVQAIAAHADQNNLDSALHHAIVRRDLEVIRVLLAQGADPEDLHDDFEQAVLHSDRHLVAVLLSGAKIPCLRCRSAALLVAVENDEVDILKLLLGKSADVNYNHGEAIISAVQAQKSQYVSLLVSGPSPASPEILDNAMFTAFDSMGQKHTPCGLTLMDICLGAGADGLQTERLFTDGLVEAVKKRHGRLVRLILKHSTPADPHHTFAIVEAIKGYQKEALHSFLQLEPSTTALAAGMSHAMSVKDSNRRLELVRMLLSAGAYGRPVSEAFIHSVRLLARSSTNAADEKSDLGLVDLLLEKGGANFSHNRGEALRIAIWSNCIEIIRKILEKQPSQEAMEAALLAAIGVKDWDGMLQVVGLLLETGLRGTIVDQCLVNAVQSKPDNTALVELLLTRASVNYNCGEALTRCIENQDLNSLRLLLERQPDDLTLTFAMQASLTLAQVTRLPYIKELLPFLKPFHLHDTLKELVQEEEHDFTLVRLLMDKGAKVSATDNFCLQYLASNFRVDMLELVASYCTPDISLFSPILDELIRRGDSWNMPSRFGTICVLLKCGVSVASASRALVHVVRDLDASNNDALPVRLVKVLLDHDADPNTEGGMAAVYAAERGCTQALGWMVNANLTVAHCVAAFTAGVQAKHKEDIQLAIIDVFIREGAIEVFRQRFPGGHCAHFVLSLYPASAAIAKRLHEAGCDFECTVDLELVAEYDQDRKEMIDYGLEPVPLLFWALLQANEGISSAVIGAIVDCGGESSFSCCHCDSD